MVYDRCKRKIARNGHRQGLAVEVGRPSIHILYRRGQRLHQALLSEQRARGERRGSPAHRLRHEGARGAREARPVGDRYRPLPHNAFPRRPHRRPRGGHAAQPLHGRQAADDDSPGRLPQVPLEALPEGRSGLQRAARRPLPALRGPLGRGRPRARARRRPAALRGERRLHPASHVQDQAHPRLGPELAIVGAELRRRDRRPRAVHERHALRPGHAALRRGTLRHRGRVPRLPALHRRRARVARRACRPAARDQGQDAAHALRRRRRLGLKGFVQQWTPYLFG